MAIIPDEHIINLWHGTNPKGWRGIIRSGKFKAGTFFTEDEAIARQYAGMACSVRMKPVAMYVAIDKRELYYNGYYSAKCDLHYIDGIYQKKV